MKKYKMLVANVLINLSPEFANVLRKKFVNHSNVIDPGFEVLLHVVLHVYIVYTLQELSNVFFL